jgi:transglutaminase-like putative cysteine protease
MRVVGDGDEQARKKVETIRRMVVQPALGPGPHGLANTRKILAEILGGTPKKAVNGYEQSRTAVRIFEWVKSRIRYVKDPTGRELFQQIPALLQAGIGDCDDFTAIIAALFAAAGIKVRARIIKVKRGGPWAHIYPVAELDGKWRAFDGALPQALDQRAGKAGFEYPNPAQRLDLEVV